MADEPQQPKSRRMTHEEKRQFQREFDAAIAAGGEGRFRLVLRVWGIEKGTNEWLWAWQEWDREREAERDARAQKGSLSKRRASPRAPRA